MADLGDDPAPRVNLLLEARERGRLFGCDIGAAESERHVEFGLRARGALGGCLGGGCGGCLAVIDLAYPLGRPLAAATFFDRLALSRIGVVIARLGASLARTVDLAVAVTIAINGRQGDAGQGLSPRRPTSARRAAEAVC